MRKLRGKTEEITNSFTGPKDNVASNTTGSTNKDGPLH